MRDDDSFSSIHGAERAQAEPAARSATASRLGPRVFLVRHADAGGGPKDPQLGKHLSDLGRRQADALARRLARWQIDALLCSDLFRAHETALAVHAFHPRVPLIVDPTFREFSRGKLEALERGDPAHADLPARLESAWQKVLGLSQGVAVLVTHNGLIKYLLRRALRIEGELKPRFHSAETGITALQVKAGARAHVQFFNDTRHLTPDLVSGKPPWLEDASGRWFFGSEEEDEEDEEAAEDVDDEPSLGGHRSRR